MGHGIVAVVRNGALLENEIRDAFHPYAEENDSREKKPTPYRVYPVFQIITWKRDVRGEM